MLNVTGRPAEALAAFERALAIVQKLAEANPNVTRFQVQLARRLRPHRLGVQADRQAGRGAGCVRAGARDHAEAGRSRPQRRSCTRRSTGDLSRPDGRNPPGGRPSLRGSYGRPPSPSRSWSGCRSLATDRSTTTWPAYTPQLAGIATKPGSGMTAAEGRAEAERAMEWLHRAVAAGYRNVALMQRRSRPRPAAIAPRLPAPDDGPRIPR